MTRVRVEALHSLTDTSWSESDSGIRWRGGTVCTSGSPTRRSTDPIGADGGTTGNDDSLRAASRMLAPGFSEKHSDDRGSCRQD